MKDEKRNEQEPKQKLELEDLEPQEAKTEQIKGGPGGGIIISPSA